MAITPGFARAIAGTGPVFAAFLIRHILAGLTALASGALAMVSRKGTRLHARIGTGYFWAIAVLAATAAGLTTIRGPATCRCSCMACSPSCWPAPDGTPGGIRMPGPGGDGPAMHRTSWP